SLGIFPILTVFGVFRLRKQKTGSILLAGFPFTQVIYIVTGVTMLVLSYLERPAESSVAALTVIAGIPAYYLFKRASSGNKMS
ncbi:MAG: hypothetical protein MUD02_08665, partial [Bacteroidales bacterium]|nr:hypothetical protein [Bacteroidales bacterium]